MVTVPILRAQEKNILLSLWVVPGAKSNQLKLEGEQLKLRLRARAVEGQANKAVIEFLSEYLKIPKSRLQIVKGELSRQKTVSILNFSLDQAQVLLFERLHS